MLWWTWWYAIQILLQRKISFSSGLLIQDHAIPRAAHFHGWWRLRVKGPAILLHYGTILMSNGVNQSSGRTCIAAQILLLPILLPSPPFHRCSAPKYSLTNILHPELHLRIWILEDLIGFINFFLLCANSHMDKYMYIKLKSQFSNVYMPSNHLFYILQEFTRKRSNACKISVCSCFTCRALATKEF